MRILAEKEAEDFLEEHGFIVARRKYTESLNSAINAANQLRYPIVLKVSSNKIIHKSDVGGVITDIRNDKELINAFNKLKKIKGFKGVLIHEFLDGYFLLLGIKYDQTFGHVIALGTGGIYTEILKDITFRVCPIDKKDALEMIEELKIYKILSGYRGKEGINFNNLINILINLSKLPLKFKTIKELDINPLIISDKFAKIADARIVFN